MKRTTLFLLTIALIAAGWLFFAPPSAFDPFGTSDDPVTNRSRNDDQKASPRKVSLTFRAYNGDAPGPCVTDCDALDVSISGFLGDHSYKYTTDIIASDGSESPSGDISTSSDGDGTEEGIAYYNRVIYDETYCVTVDGVTGCVDGR